MKNMPAPFIGGRSRFEEVTKHAAVNIGFDVEYRQTRSPKKAWDNIASFVDAGIPVGVKLDCYFLDYFSSDFHFAAHYVAVHGYNENQIFVIDTVQQGRNLTTSRELFEEGRLWKGPMASNALTWTVKVTNSEIDWPTSIRKAIRANAISYLNPPIKNFGASGIRKTAAMAPDWLDTIKDAPQQLMQMGMLIEQGGTGGGLFRRMYRDFLAEANEYLNSPVLDQAQEMIGASSQGWTKISVLLAQIEDDSAALSNVSELLLQNADLEEKAFGLLATL